MVLMLLETLCFSTLSIQICNFFFRNTELVSLTEQFIFTKPFDKSDSTNRLSEDISCSLPQLYDNPRVLEAANFMKGIFLNKKECLVHGDLHTGSIMVNEDETKVCITCAK